MITKDDYMIHNELIVDNFAGGYKPSAELVRANLPEMCGGGT